MASVVLRNGASSLRHFNRSLCYYRHHMWAPTLESSSIKRSHSLLHPFLPTSGIPLDYARKAYIFPIKHLSSSVAESELSTLKKPEEAATKEEKTGESHQNGSAGKSVRSSSAAESELSTPKKPEEAATKEEKTEESHQNGSAGKSVRGGPVSWLSLLSLMLTGVGLIYYYDKEKKRHIEELNTASTEPKQGPSAGKAAIGGPFSLLNHHGKSITDQDFLGKWTLIYFGFTHCPDICPDELQKLAAAVDRIKEKAGLEIVPVFISVDPERDTVEQVREYVQEFHSSLIGLTGDSDSIRQVARAYRVYYMKTEEEGSDYLVDHSIVMYLMDPKMEFVKFFGKNYDVDTLTEGIIKEIKQHKR